MTNSKSHIERTLISPAPRPLGEVTLRRHSWAFAPEAVGDASFDPSYAVDFWDLTNRQDWAACEAVQRGLSSPFASPGPLSPEEDAIYSFVTTVARGYQGMRVTERAAETGLTV